MYRTLNSPGWILGALWMCAAPAVFADEAASQFALAADHYSHQRWDLAAEEFEAFLGRCLSMQARFSEAREAFHRVVRSTTGGRTETAAMAQWMIGESFFHQKEYREAVRAYHRVVSLHGYPQWQAAALLQAGKCHEQSGEWQEAVKLYTQLLRDYSDTTHAADASQRMRVAQRSAGINTN